MARRNVLKAPAALGAGLAALVLTATACSSSGSSSPPSQANAGGGQTGSGAAATVTVETHSGPLGTYLTDEHGRSLYMFASDTSSKSACTGQCLSFWPPVTEKATASSGAKASMLGTVTDANGTKQVTYGGHPLYTYSGDNAAGDTNGQGSNTFGAKWWLLAPSGQPITGASSSGSSSSSSGGGGGGWS